MMQRFRGPSLLGSLLLIVPLAVVGQENSSPQKKVLIIGIDGCRPDALLAAKAPHLHGLIKNGAFSAKAQTGDMTASGSGWGSLLTGVWRQKHGVRGNDFKLANFTVYPDFLARTKEARPGSFVASIVHWDPIQKLIVKNLDVNAAYKTDAEVATAAEKLLIQKNPDILFVHFDDVDGAGHGHGFHPGQPRYLAAIEKTDAYVGRLLETIRKRPTYAKEDWLIVVSTDHGGSGKGHGRDIPEHRTIFVIVSGKSTTPGIIEPPPGIIDIAPTVLTHLGIAIDPKWSLDGKSVGLKVLKKSKFLQVLETLKEKEPYEKVWDKVKPFVPEPGSRREIVHFTCKDDVDGTEYFFLFDGPSNDRVVLEKIIRMTGPSSGVFVLPR